MVVHLSAYVSPSSRDPAYLLHVCQLGLSVIISVFGVHAI